MSERILGIDLGIASCGWAIIETGDASGEIVAAGVRCFDAPLVDKTGEPKSAQRRTARGQRRVIRRRRQRMNSVRALLHHHGLLPNSSKNALGDALRRISPKDQHHAVTPWGLRASALDRALTSDELAVVLGHIARHRGFRSNSKREASANAADETSKMKKAMELTREGLARYRSFGEMLASDEKFANRKRNREKDYSHTPKRSDLEAEVRNIFAAQRRFGNTIATPDLENEFSHRAFDQRPLQDSEDKVGSCPFEPTDKRTAKRAPSFELFRFLQRLVNIRITLGRNERSLTPEEIGIIKSKFGQQKSYTYKTLRKDLDIDPNARFTAIARDKEELDIAARKGQSALGTCVLRDVLGNSPWLSLLKTPEKLDRVAEVLTFHEGFDSIHAGLSKIGLYNLVVDRLMTATREGVFADFKPKRGAAHISALAARKLGEQLAKGLNLEEACRAIGYPFPPPRIVSLKDIGSPVARRAFGEAIKQVRVVAREYGPIQFVHVELARDVAKSPEERRKLEDGIEERNVEKDRRKADAAAILGRAVSDDELLRYELAIEQNFKCVHCDGAIAPDGFAANDTRYQTDHILPWSRFGDDSYLNKSLCCASCNQHKRGRTPFEWFSEDKSEEEWQAFATRVDTLKEMKGLKKRNYRLKDAASVENKFKTRNLTDTRWATRLLAEELKRMFPAREEEPRVFTRPGAITSKLRRAWGLAELKKIGGERVDDDRHHAIDALVLAATTESLLQKMTREIQQREREGRSDDIFHVQSPWPGFRLDAIRAVYGADGMGGVFVSRAERHRARGKGHDATIRQVSIREGKALVYERKRVTDLKLTDLDRVKDPERNAKLIIALRDWIEAGKPKDWKPLSPKGDPIAKVRLRTDKKADILVWDLSGRTLREGGSYSNGNRAGAADRGDMARVDVFRKLNKRGRFEYFVVPIYPHQIADTKNWRTAPNRAVQAHTNEAYWPTITEDYEFLFSISPMGYLQLTTAKGEIIEGYFREMNRNDAGITVSVHFSNDARSSKVGSRTLRDFRKFRIDRLGRRFEVRREGRTWRGKTVHTTPQTVSLSVACTVSNAHGVERPASDAAE